MVMMNEDIELLTVMQVGTELGVSASTVGKLIKQYPRWVTASKRGRSVFYTNDALKRLKLIRKLQEQKKSDQQIESALSKKFEPISNENNLLLQTESKHSERKIKSKSGTGLIKQVNQLKAMVKKLDARVTELSKELNALKKSQSGQTQIDKLESELKRISKILEG